MRTYGVATAWSSKSILFWTITVGISPHSFSTCKSKDWNKLWVNNNVWSNMSAISFSNDWRHQLLTNKWQKLDCIESFRIESGLQIKDSALFMKAKRTRHIVHITKKENQIKVKEMCFRLLITLYTHHHHHHHHHGIICVDKSIQARIIFTKQTHWLLTQFQSVFAYDHQKWIDSR